MEEIARKARSLPNQPGVYLFKAADGRIIYVGKAASLRKRVGSYFSPRENENPRIASLRSRIEDVDFVVTSGEVEALILEANLIKRHHPDYNIEFRDDKSYPYMVICVNDTYPRVMFMRGQRSKGSLYYGPFSHAGAVRETIETLRKVFPFRACRGREPGKKQAGPCLDYHIGLCSGPCTGAVTPDEYREIIEGVREFMEGKHHRIMDDLERRMYEDSSRLEFEKAARTRDRLSAFNRLLERQQAHSLKEGDQDVFAVHHDELDACVTVFYIRGGKILGKKDFFTFLPTRREEGEILVAFLPQFYHQATYFPREILLSHAIPRADADLLEGWLSEKSGRKVEVKTPLRGEKKCLVEKVEQNAAAALDVYLIKQSSDLGWISRAVDGIYRGLELEHLPYRIECYDISNLGSQDAVGSMVVYEGGLPKRGDYRRFKIKKVEGQNDVAMMEEVLERRLAKLASGLRREAGEKKEGEAGVAGRKKLDSFQSKPDLILVDGGEAQLGASIRALDRWGFNDIDAASLAKRLEKVYLPARDGAVVLPRDSEALHLLQRIRDEAHRYALDYHRMQRSRRIRRSLLDDVSGIGPKRKKSLLRHYGSLTRIADASLVELKGLSFMDRRAADNLYRRFHPEGG
ncbi:MAG: excinuclease ABC subunit UvrC [Actinomycetota bacterium]|nr:excinuclease ABC subunit UvrC [Actinomycetota bacterium]